MSEHVEGDGPLHLKTRVTHARQGALRHAFTYTVDYLMIDPEAGAGPGLMARDRFGLVSVNTRDHGGPRGAGKGAPWAREALREAGLGDQSDVALRLLAQPRFLGIWFSPVSFWLALRDGEIIAMITEVNNTFGQRHSYLCHTPDFAPLDPAAEYTAAKVFHVSPFQDVAGDYRFRIRLHEGKLTLRIHHVNGAGGVLATMVGRLVPLTNRRLLGAVLRRPVWPVRVVTLIHWHAFLLWLKGAVYRPVPVPPDKEVSH